MRIVRSLQCIDQGVLVLQQLPRLICQALNVAVLLVVFLVHSHCSLSQCARKVVLQVTNLGKVCVIVRLVGLRHLAVVAVKLLQQLLQRLHRLHLNVHQLVLQHHHAHLWMLQQPDVVGRILLYRLHHPLLQLLILQDQLARRRVLFVQHAAHHRQPLLVLGLLAPMCLQDERLELLRVGRELVTHLVPGVHQARHLCKPRPLGVLTGHVVQQRLHPVQVGLPHQLVVCGALPCRLLLHQGLLLALLDLNHLVLVLLHGLLHICSSHAAVVQVRQVLDV
mmetsp:Transcript_38120/g.84951  ORF Transcript_38120/g.84951 Transcript_38120/m.84951 type:complete len:279 (+) Transcript_38120:594-1430(+)